MPVDSKLLEILCCPVSKTPLKAATSTAAEMLKRPDLGTLAAGQTADIVAVPADPFQDISVMGRVDFVMMDGEICKQPTP